MISMKNIMGHYVSFSCETAFSRWKSYPVPAFLPSLAHSAEDEGNDATFHYFNLSKTNKI